jgi:PIN domain nuclease of toxin-antitoxin system
MKKYLLDTHILLWILEDNEKLSHKSRALMVEDYVKNYISIASVWEIAIKINLGKLKLEGGVARLIESVEYMGIDIINIEPSYIIVIEGLERHHKDPFDRLIIATAMQEKMTVLSSDAHFDLYDVQLERN